MYLKFQKGLFFSSQTFGTDFKKIQDRFIFYQKLRKGKNCQRTNKFLKKGII